MTYASAIGKYGEMGELPWSFGLEFYLKFKRAVGGISSLGGSYSLGFNVEGETDLSRSIIYSMEGARCLGTYICWSSWLNCW